MISHGSQGAIPKEQQVKALHVLVDELDVPMAPHYGIVYKQPLSQSPIPPSHSDVTGT